MKISKFYYFLIGCSVLFLLTRYFVKQNISDRETSLKIEKLETNNVKSFVVAKQVLLELSHNKLSNLNDLNFQWLIFTSHPNGSDLVFKGSLKEINSKKISLPKSYELDSSYYLLVHAIDLKNKKVYKWSSDVSYKLNTRTLNHLQLLYTGNKEESITLKVNKN